METTDTNKFEKPEREKMNENELTYRLSLSDLLVSRCCHYALRSVSEYLHAFSTGK